MAEIKVMASPAIAPNASPKAAPEAGSVVVITGRGRDGPGIAKAFVDVTVEYDCRVVDMAQFLLEDYLVFTFVVEVGRCSSWLLFKDMVAVANERDMHLDFQFPKAEEKDLLATEFHEAVVSVVTSGGVTPSVLQGIDEVLSELGCSINEIEHRSDNKAENNGDFTKLQIRVNVPFGVRLATLYMGAPNKDKATGLCHVAEDNGVVITTKWWDAMNRPHGKSLVVFALSKVLCPYEVLDELLKETGADMKQVEELNQSGEHFSQVNMKKIAMLKGKSTAAVQKLLDRLELTPGAKVLTQALKAMGIRTAILSASGMSHVADHVKQKLGIDYVICQGVGVEGDCFTGTFAGEASDVRFRKADLLKLMADREGIESRNVIVIGEFLRGMKISTARLMLETFGQNIHFQADGSEKFKNLKMVLYLLGFHGLHVKSLQQKYEPELGAKQAWPEVSTKEEGTRYIVQVDGRTRAVGQVQQIFKPLKTFGKEVELSTVRMCSLEDGGMCLGVEMIVKKDDPDQVVKELMFSCHMAGFQLRVDKATIPKWSTAKIMKNFSNRYMVTLVQKPRLATESLQSIFSAFATRGVNIIKFERLSSNTMAALQLTVTLPDDLSASAFSTMLTQVSNETKIDISSQKDDEERFMRRLIVFDMDSTLIQQEVIDELAKLCGVVNDVKKITDAAMEGQIDFFESLKQRVSLLEGNPADELFQQVKDNLIFTPGAKRLCDTLKRLGFKMAVISGGFLPVAKEVQRHLGLDYAFANTLDVDERTGKLTGVTSGPVVTPNRKRSLLATIANVEGCSVAQTIAVGDGANDIPMLNTAGLGIAFCAKPKVQAATEFHINQKDLSTVLFLVGLSESAADWLSAEEGTLSRETTCA
eukprot:gnl/TRDRNA2_/TRDRNA2_125235_c0_seq1.p1 gnl/TRDRNA2_/TRDRNA2_125235_c0~~gnl/TRDRNA2_/TRDRNA2_125235_c0_seq1.p1  ORF type:complete len:873 (+),score=207.97 gnl/TRDRNA2_/TRDRNA2_125235_c0_seq1:60-2678(+)